MIHPTTRDERALHDLTNVLGMETMPSHGKVISFDVEQIGFDLEPVPLDEVLEFRNECRDSHAAYIRNLRGFMVELGEEESPDAREALLRQRQEEISTAAKVLHRNANQAFGGKLRSMGIAIGGAAWTAATGDAVSMALSGLGLLDAAWQKVQASQEQATAYSYLFSAEQRYGK